MDTMYFIWLTIRCFQSGHFQNLSVFFTPKFLRSEIEKPPYLVQSHLVINKFKKQMFYHSCSISIIINKHNYSCIWKKLPWLRKGTSIQVVRTGGTWETICLSGLILPLGHGGPREGAWLFHGCKDIRTQNFWLPFLCCFHHKILWSLLRS